MERQATERQMTEREIAERFPGIGCAWMDATGSVAVEFHGFADRERDIPVDGDTIFPACSISKFVTAICVMKLHEQEALDIDAPVNRYLRQWKLLAKDGRESGATIRSLLCHTSGIADGEGAFHGLRRGDPVIGLTDILEGRTAYNNRPVRSEKPHGTAFEYSDAGYCVLQLLIQEVARKAFEDFAREIVFDPLRLQSTFFASPANVDRFESSMATGYGDDGSPLPGRFPPVPDLAASGLWSTPAELLTIARAFVEAMNGKSALLRKESAREMAKPADVFPWTGLGVFIGGRDTLVSQGWGENGQCMMKMNCRTGEISVAMTNRDPGFDQSESGVEWLVDRRLSGGK